MKESLLLVFANKQDVASGTHGPLDPLCLLASTLHEPLTRGSDADMCQTAMKPQEVTDALKLNQLKDKIWYVVPSCATTGEGLLEGLVSVPVLYIKRPILPFCTLQPHTLTRRPTPS